ncbi:hypothetical protein MY10362_008401 [Beauveria mimosiformis]
MALVLAHGSRFGLEKGGLAAEDTTEESRTVNLRS